MVNEVLLVKVGPEYYWDRDALNCYTNLYRRAEEEDVFVIGFPDTFLCDMPQWRIEQEVKVAMEGAR